MNKKRALFAIFSLGVMLAASQPLTAMKAEINNNVAKKTEKNSCNENKSLQKEYAGFKASVTEQAKKTRDAIKNWGTNGIETLQTYWTSGDAIDKTLMLGASATGGYLLSCAFPRTTKAAIAGAIVSILYFSYKAFAQKPQEKSWREEITDDIKGAYTWAKSFFVTPQQETEQREEVEEATE